MVAAAPIAGRMSLKNRISGRVEAPLRVLLYGVEGVGKSTFGSNAPSPIFLGEEGASTLDVDRFPEPKTWEDVLEAVYALTVEGHDRQTLVIDTADWLEPLCWAHTCRRAGKSSIEDFGYGKGYIAALDEWRVLLARLDALRASKKMHVVTLAHCVVRPFKNPDIESGDYDRYELKLHQKTGGLLKEWSDAVLFANHETLVKKEKDRTRGLSTGARLIYTERRAAWDAKNRFGLPERMALSWDDFYQAVRNPVDVKVVRLEIGALIEQVDADTAAKAKAWLTGPNASVPKHLAEMANKLRTKVVQPKEEATK